MKLTLPTGVTFNAISFLNQRSVFFSVSKVAKPSGIANFSWFLLSILFHLVFGLFDPFVRHELINHLFILLNNGNHFLESFWKVANYGIGGRYTPHQDFGPVQVYGTSLMNPEDEIRGDRIATLMTYVIDDGIPSFFLLFLSNESRFGTTHPSIKPGISPESEDLVSWTGNWKNGYMRGFWKV